MEGPLPLPMADVIADILISGETGYRLMRRLRSECREAKREDYVYGVSLAVSCFEADRIGLLADLHQAWEEIRLLRDSGTPTP
jgi:hypothetical protein